MIYDIISNAKRFLITINHIQNIVFLHNICVCVCNITLHI